MPSTLIYCDTNIYLDYFYDRKDTIRSLGEFAARIFERTFSCEFKIVISDWVLKEIRKMGSEQYMTELTKELEKKQKLAIIALTDNDLKMAENLPNHWEDAVHVILAKRSGAQFIVTSNVKDFRSCEDIISSFLPNEV